MAYTYSDLIADGSGRVVYYLLIPGVCVVGTTKDDPTDAWYTDTDLDYYDWLVHESCGEIRDSIDYLTAEARCRQISVDVIDYDEGFIGLTSSWRSQIRTYLTSTLTAAATTAVVEDTSDFPATGDICIGAERMTYSGKTATSFTGLDRTAYGTTAEEHYVDLTGDIPIQPVVVQSPTQLDGRRAYLYAAAVDPELGTRGASTCIYRGRITGRTRVGRGRFRVSIKHCIDTLYDATAGNALGSATLKRGMYHSSEGSFLGDVQLFVDDWTASAVVQGAQTSSFSTGWRSHEEARVDLNVALQQAWDNAGVGTSSRRPNIVESDGKYTLILAGGSSYKTSLVVEKYSMMWCLGFDAGTYDATGSGDAGIHEFQAQRDPAPLFVDMSDYSYSSATAVFYVDDEDATIQGSAYGFIKGNPYFKIVSQTLGLVTITTATLDSTWFRGPFILVEDDDITEVTNCLPLAPESGDRSIKTALERLLHLESSQDEPSRWCALGVQSDDIDWTELDDCLGGINPALNDVHHVVIEPTTPYDAIGHHLALLGICPRITDESKIGFTRISTPTRSDAISVQIDSDQWDANKAADIEAELESAELLSVIKIDPGLDYTSEDDDDYGDPLTLTWREATTVLRTPREIELKIPGLVIPALRYYGITTTQIKQLINSYVINTHFAGFGRENATIEIPCTTTAASVKCGDVVIVTHELAPNLGDGEMGISDEIGIVEARDYRHSRGQYSVTVRIGARLPTGGITPTAHATAWSSASKVLSFSTADTPLYAQDGSDLDGFNSSADAIPVLLVERDSTSPSVWSATIDAGGVDTTAKTAALTAAVMSDGAFPSAGVYMIPQTWGSAWADHQDYAYVASLSTAPELGSDDGMVWTI